MSCTFHHYLLLLFHVGASDSQEQSEQHEKGLQSPGRAVSADSGAHR